MTLGLLAALLVSAIDAPEVTEEPDSTEPLNWEIYGAAMGGLRLSEVGGGGSGVLGVNRRFGWVRPELVVGMGLYDRPVELLILIRIGARIEWQRDGALKPYLWLAFAHNHESGLEHVKANPVAHILGVSEHGVRHRSGAEGGLGLSYDLPRMWKGRLAGRVGSRLTFTQFFADTGPPRYLDLSITTGLSF
jgi:hypothetical protein